MATYKKNNYRPNRGKESKKEGENSTNTIPADVEKNSTTAEVFNSLNEGAHKTEKWIEKNSKFIIISVVALLVFGLGYGLYRQIYKLPNEKEAALAFDNASIPFKEALDATDTKAKEALFTEALNGRDGQMGLLKISEKYSGTKAANLANYSIGMAYLQINKYGEAIEYLDKFSMEVTPLNTLAYGGIGDAFMQIKQEKDAVQYYEKAIESTKDSYTIPIYLKKAADACVILKNYDKAKTYLERIKNEFPKSDQGRTVEIELSRIETLKENK